MDRRTFLKSATSALAILITPLRKVKPKSEWTQHTVTWTKSSDITKVYLNGNLHKSLQELASYDDTMEVLYGDDNYRCKCVKVPLFDGVCDLIPLYGDSWG